MAQNMAARMLLLEDQKSNNSNSDFLTSYASRKIAEFYESLSSLSFLEGKFKGQNVEYVDNNLNPIDIKKASHTELLDFFFNTPNSINRRNMVLGVKSGSKVVFANTKRGTKSSGAVDNAFIELDLKTNEAKLHMVENKNSSAPTTGKQQAHINSYLSYIFNQLNILHNVGRPLTVEVGEYLQAGLLFKPSNQINATSFEKYLESVSEHRFTEDYYYIDKQFGSKDCNEPIPLEMFDKSIEFTQYIVSVDGYNGGTPIGLWKGISNMLSDDICTGKV